jgi:hypothetical protein
MTLIQQTSDCCYTLTTEKGREVQVAFYSWGRVNIFAGTGLGYGRNFDSLAEAITGYKSADVKAALSALAAGI